MTTARTVFHQTPRLPDPNNYPLSMWEQQRSRYWEYWCHFDGDWLDETISETAEDINERLADVGDIVSENARLLPAIANTRKVGITRLGYGTSFINLGSTAPGMDKPDTYFGLITIVPQAAHLAAGAVCPGSDLYLLTTVTSPGLSRLSKMVP